MSDIGPELPEDEALAAEHALGVLTARERAAAETRMAIDPAFAAEVDAWRLRLANSAFMHHSKASSRSACRPPSCTPSRVGAQSAGHSAWPGVFHAIAASSAANSQRTRRAASHGAARSRRAARPAQAAAAEKMETPRFGAGRQE